jgi:hypothetical protein
VFVVNRNVLTDNWDGKCPCFSTCNKESFFRNM